MPTFNIYVTTPKNEIPAGFLADASKLIAQLVGKPESRMPIGCKAPAGKVFRYVCVRVIPDQMIIFGGSIEPCGSLELMSLGAIGEQNKGYAKAIADFMESKLNIPSNRFYVTFTDITRLNCAYGGKTFAG